MVDNRSWNIEINCTDAPQKGSLISTTQEQLKLKFTSVANSPVVKTVAAIRHKTRKLIPEMSSYFKKVYITIASTVVYQYLLIN